MKPDVQSHSRNVGQHRTTVPAQLSLTSLSLCVQGLNQQVGENSCVKNQGVHKLLCSLQQWLTLADPRVSL